MYIDEIGTEVVDVKLECGGHRGYLKKYRNGDRPLDHVSKW
jgi:hypothetical protein